MYRDSTSPAPSPAPVMAQRLRARLHQFLAPLLLQLDAQIDARLVRTFSATIEVLLRFRHRHSGLLLSELGAFLLPPPQAPAGTKRLSNLLRSPKWHATLLAQFLWQQAAQRVAEGAAAAEALLVVWDESVLEKPESRAAEGLCPVRSSKAARLTRPQPGCFRKPGPPVVVPGLHWLGLLLLGESGPPTVAAMHWFTLPRRSRRQEPGQKEAGESAPAPAGAAAGAAAEHGSASEGEGEPGWPVQAPDLRTVRQRALGQAVAAWGRRVLHVFDRGYAGSPWLGALLGRAVRFVLRWPKRYSLVDALGRARPAWQFARGKRAWGHRRFWDPRRRCYFRVGVLAFAVRHPDYDTPLWLVVSRAGRGGEPWYLLTSEPVHTEADAWKVVTAYARRWQIELAFRYSKSELALESPRLWRWESRLKLLLMVTLAYAFLLQLLERTAAEVRQWLLRHYCHRTGRRARAAKAPLYRLRAALSRLWSDCSVTPLAPDSG